MIFSSYSAIPRRAFAHSRLPRLPAFLVELYGARRVSARLSGHAKGTRGSEPSVSIMVNRHEELSDRSAPYADFALRSWIALRRRSRSAAARRFSRDYTHLQSLRREVSLQSPSNYACIMVGYMHISIPLSIGVKRVQAQRPRDRRKPPALDRRRQRLIVDFLGYAVWTPYLRRLDRDPHRLILGYASHPQAASCVYHYLLYSLQYLYSIDNPHTTRLSRQLPHARTAALATA
jgi:hypothetical protein